VRLADVRAKLDSGLVVTRSDLTRLPAVRLPAGFEMRPMDMHDRADIAAWLAIHNDAYGRSWKEDDYRWAILDHPILEVSDTFFVVGDEGPVGAASVGVFRRNERVGAGHYLGVMRSAQGLGLGRQLVAHRYAVLRDRGFTACESQTQIGRTPSLIIHFECGFQPKPRRDHWNSHESSRTLRTISDRRLRSLYRRWRRSQPG
jgi:GNAT superfamily N-acetyltransferase